MLRRTNRSIDTSNLLMNLKIPNRMYYLGAIWVRRLPLMCSQVCGEVISSALTRPQCLGDRVHVTCASQTLSFGWRGWLEWPGVGYFPPPGSGRPSTAVQALLEHLGRPHQEEPRALGIPRWLLQPPFSLSCYSLGETFGAPRDKARKNVTT